MGENKIVYVGFFMVFLVFITACQSLTKNTDGQGTDTTVLNKTMQITNSIRKYIKTINPILSENFSVKSNEWPISPQNEEQDRNKTGKVGYQDGKYFIEADPGSENISHNWITVPAGDLSEFVFEVECEVKTISDNDVGAYVIGFLTSKKDTYSVVFDSNGRFTLNQNTAEGHSIIQTSNLQNNRGVKKIQIIVKGSQIFVFIDDVLKQQYDNRLIISGSVGIDVFTSVKTPYRIEIDNVKIWNISEYK